MFKLRPCYGRTYPVQGINFIHLPTSVPVSFKNSMQQSSYSEADSLSATQQIPRLLWNTKFHYHIHNSPPLVPILRQMNSVHTFPPYFPKVHSYISFPSTISSSVWCLPFRFLDKNFVCISPLFHAGYMPHLSHMPSIDHPNNTLWSLQVMKFLITQSSPASLKVQIRPFSLVKVINCHVLVSNLYWIMTCNKCNRGTSMYGGNRKNT
jgi:hypothetical protein